MITLRDAAMKAMNFYKEIDPDAEDARVEEVEKDDETDDWHITLSFQSNENSANLIMPNSASTGVMNGRKYKIFSVDSTSGEVRSMKIRVLQR